MTQPWYHLVGLKVEEAQPAQYRNKLLHYLSYVTVEPTMVLYMMAFMTTSVVEQSFYVYKACTVNHGYNSTICQNINDKKYENITKEVQVTVADFHLWNSIAGHGVPVILALFMGSWSDKRGRKLPLLIGLAGKLYFSAMIVLNTMKPDWPIQYVIYTATLPSALTGADVAIFAAAFTYICDITSQKSRTMRVTILELCAYGSLAFGYDSGGDQAACGRPYRAGRVYQPPCDLEKQSFCTSAGETYPWHAVKRFVKDNQGLMRRMYGDQRHGNVLRAELEDELDVSLRYSRYQHQDVDENDVFPREDADESEARYLRDDLPNDDVLKTKFVYSEEPVISIKLAGLKTPYFRPTTQRTTKATSAKQEETTETTVTEAVEINTTTETTEGITSTKSDGSEEASSTTKGEIGEQETDKSGNDSEKKDKVETMLFQDMEDEASKKKVFVNYKLKGINACPVKEEVVAPFWANNTRGEVLALLNMYPFEQYVHWEKCSFEHRQMYCRDGCRCEQQYRLHRLLAYDPNNECRGIFSDWFRFPSCCVCKCYDMPMEFRVTSRSPRYHATFPDE